MSKLSKCVCALVMLAAVASLTSAATVSINFVGGSSSNNGASVAPTDLAGVVDPTDTGNPAYADTYVPNWNNAPGSSGTSLPLVAHTGQATAASLTFSARNSTWSIGTPLATGNDKMWFGYIDSFGGGVSDPNVTTVTVDGLIVDPQKGSYDVIVYFDGSNGGQWRKANFQIGGTTQDGEDSENTNWKAGSGQNQVGYFQIPTPGAGGNQPFGNPPPGNATNNDEGNYVVFTGLTDPTLVLKAWPGANAGTARAPINGIQVVGVEVPEPATLALAGLALGGLGAYVRRRRTA